PERNTAEHQSARHSRERREGRQGDPPRQSRVQRGNRPHEDPWGKEIYWIGGGRITWTGGADSDFRATSDGYISVTPLHMDMTNYSLIEVVRKWFPGD